MRFIKRDTFTRYSRVLNITVGNPYSFFYVFPEERSPTCTVHLFIFEWSVPILRRIGTMCGMCLIYKQGVRTLDCMF